MTQSTYLLGDSPTESQRLAAQHRAWLEITLRSWRRAGLGMGQRVLDVGAGPGLATRELAWEVGREGLVTALDQSAVFIDQLQELANELTNIEVVQGTIENAELAADQFDLAYARWVFCFLAEPRVAIERLVDCLRPGGQLLVMDYFNYPAFALAPRAAAMEAVVAAIMASWRHHDGSLDVAGSLPELMEQSGLVVEHINPVSPIARPGEPLWIWPRDFLTGYVPELVEQNFLTPEQAELFWESWQKRENTPGSYLYLPPILEIIARKP